MPLEKKILILLGSPSDESILNNLQEDPTIYLDYKFASAHKTPDLVMKYLTEEKWDAVIAAASKSNVLANMCLRYVDVTTPILALPLSDKNTLGLVSILSSQETPTGYPIAVTKMDDINNAVKIAKNLVSCAYEEIMLILNSVSKEAIKVCDTLKDFGVEYDICNLHECKNIRKNESLPLIISGLDDYSLDDLKLMNRQLGDQCAIASYIIDSTGFYGDSTFVFDYLSGVLKNYMDANKSLSNIATIGFSNGTNLALFGIKILARSDAALKKKLLRYLDEGQKRYYGENEKSGDKNGDYS